jgi:cobalt-zinc-cadmium efflux system membrane fusion protein
MNMKRMFATVIVGVAVLGAGAAGVFLAGRFGLLPGRAQAERRGTKGLCEHGIPEASCPFCYADLVNQFDLCGEHGVPEGLCTRCKPALIPAFKATGDWCKEHQLPESQDEQCNPGVLAKYEGKPSSQPASVSPISVETVAPDDLPRTQRAPTVTCTKDRSVIRLASAETVRSIGLEFEPVRRQPLHQTLVVNAEAVYDSTKFATLSSRAPGVVVAVHKTVGDLVQRGEVLAAVDSADLGSAKAALLDASATVRLWEKNHHREKSLFGQGIATEQELLDTETKLTESQIELARARQRLLNLGLAMAQIEQLMSADDSSSLLELLAPFDGTVVERAATVGEVVDTTKPLLAIADTSHMWAMLDLSQGQIQDVQVGQPVVLTIDGLRGETFAGRLAAIQNEVDPRTRTIKARAEIDNERGLLRANSFGRAEISIRHGEEALLVPKSAVQWDGCCNVVFVRESETRFRPRKVRLGVDPADVYEVLDGLDGSETVVTQGSFLLKTEVLKGSIGAGCCEVEHLAK